MIIEVNPDGGVKINTEAAQALCGIFAIHCSLEESGATVKADHNAQEICDAINASMLPVLFVDAGLGVVPCHLDRVVSHSDAPEAYEFRGFTSWGGGIDLQIDADGNVIFPK